MPHPARAGCSTKMPPRRRNSPIPAPSFSEGAMPSYNSVAVIGAGAWGTALASVAARAGRDVILYARNAEAAAHMTATRENPRLSAVSLDPRITVTSDVATAARADIVLLAVPAQNLRDAVMALSPHIAAATPLIACSKGL